MDKTSEQESKETQGSSDISTQARSLVGEIIGKNYKVVEQIGAGAMGAVYKAEHTWMDRIVAIKVLHSHLVHSETSLKRFQNEARTASKITHPNAVTLYDFGIDGDMPYLAMRFTAGETLKHVLKKEGPLELGRVRTILSQVGGAVTEAHSLGIIHRDLKPDNIMISTASTGGDWAEVLDFGIAKMTSNIDDANAVTQTGMVIGTPQYMSPEQASGKDLNHTSDIYSLGIILYEMLSANVPFSAGSLMEVLMAQINDKPIPLRKVNPSVDIPKEIERVVMRSLDKDPTRRQSSVEQLVEEFNAAVELLENRRSATSRTKILAAGLGVTAAVAGGTVFVMSNFDQAPSGVEELAESEFGQISINSKPTGAEVYIKDVLRGTTPLMVTDVEPGDYNITLRLDGYLDRSHTLEVSSSMTTQATFPLKPEATMLATLDQPERMTEEERDAAQQALEDLEAQARAEQPTPSPVPVPTAEPTPEPTVEPSVEPTETPKAVGTTQEPTEVPKTINTTVEPAELSAAEEEARLKEAAKQGVQLPPPTPGPTPEPSMEPTPRPTPEAAADEAIVIVQKPTSLSEQPKNINVAALSTPPETVSGPQGLYEEAKQLYQQGQTSQAIVKLQDALKKKKQFTAANLLLGRCYLKEAAQQKTPSKRNRKATSALAQFDMAFRSNPRNPEVRYSKAIAFAVMRNKRKTLSELEQAIKMQPSLRARAKKDPNFSWMRSDPSFKNL